LLSSVLTLFLLLEEQKDALAISGWTGELEPEVLKIGDDDCRYDSHDG
jgi:hypothetical protein